MQRASAAQVVWDIVQEFVGSLGVCSAAARGAGEQFLSWRQQTLSRPLAGQLRWFSIAATTLSKARRPDRRRASAPTHRL